MYCYTQRLYLKWHKYWSGYNSLNLPWLHLPVSDCLVTCIPYLLGAWSTAWVYHPQGELKQTPGTRTSRGGKWAQATCIQCSTYVVCPISTSVTIATIYPRLHCNAISRFKAFNIFSHLLPFSDAICLYKCENFEVPLIIIPEDSWPRACYE